MAEQVAQHVVTNSQSAGSALPSDVPETSTNLKIGGGEEGSVTSGSPHPRPTSEYPKVSFLRKEWFGGAHIIASSSLGDVYRLVSPV